MQAPSLHPKRASLRLQTRVGVAIGALIICLALVLASLLAISAEHEVLRLSRINLESLSEQMARELAVGMDQFATLAENEALRDRFRDPAAPADEMRTALDEIRHTNPAFAWIGIVDAQSGIVLASTDGVFEHGSVRGRAVFEEGLKGPFIGDVHPAVRLAELLPRLPHGEPLRFLDVSAPIRDRNGTITRVFASHLGWDWTESVRDQVFGPAAERRGTEIFLLDTEDKVVLSGDPRFPVGTNLADIAQISGNQAVERRWSDGENALTYVVRTHPQGRFASFGWKVVTRQPIDTALGPVKTLRLFFLVGALVMGLAAALLAWHLAGRILTPLRALTGLAQSGAASWRGWGKGPTENDVLAVRETLIKLQDDAKHGVEASQLSERQFALLAESLPDIVWQTDARGRIEYISKPWILAGQTTSPPTVEGLTSIIDPDDGAGFVSAWKAALLSGTKFRYRCRLITPDASLRRWHDVSANPLRNEQGLMTRWVGTMVDVNDTVRQAKEARDALDAERIARTEAERSARLRDEFLATASHELRSPLSAITGWSDILVRRGSEDAVILQAAEVIRRNAQLQTRLIDDLLDMSAVTAGKLLLRMQPVDVVDILRQVVVSQVTEAKRKGIACVLVEDGPLVVSGDEHRLTQVVSNLLHNAFKFTDKGGSIQVTAKRDGTQATISVTDTGSGIAPAFLPFVFDRLRQQDGSTTRRAGGMGLGLAIAKGLIELHHGTISAQSDGLGHGSRFTIALPLLTDDEPAPASGRPASHSSAPCSNLQGLRLLLVDDEEDSREVGRAALASVGARVVVASSALEALDLLKGSRFDALISDIGMPQMDGLALIRAVRTLHNHATASIPAVALTAFTLESDRLAALQAGFTTFVAKPISITRLAEAVRDARETAGAT